MARGRIKKRSLKADGVTKGLDMCPVCYSFGCDPMAMSFAFSEKIHNRLRQKRCPCCGKPKGFCSCKSSMQLKPGSHTIQTHNNEKLRKAEAMIQAKEQAYRIWEQNFEEIEQVLGEEQTADICISLRNHSVPRIEWKRIEKELDFTDIDLYRLKAGWEE